MLVPAIKGTVGVLESAKKYGYVEHLDCKVMNAQIIFTNVYPMTHRKSVKRIVVTASSASVFQSGYTPPVVYDETSWNEAAVADVQQNGAKAVRSFYTASKTLAERG